MKKLHHSPFTITKTQCLTPGSAPIGYAQIGLSASDVGKLESPEYWQHTELHVLPEVSAANKLANSATTSCYANQGSNLVPTHPRGP